MNAAARQTRETIDVGVTQRDSILEISAAQVIPVYATHVHATVNTANDSYTLTLPSVMEAAGQVITVWATVANSKALTLADADDSIDWSDLTLDTDDDRVVVASDGRSWNVLYNGIA